MRIAEAAEDGQLMKRALGGMRNGKLKAGFNTWCTFTAERREATALMKRAIAKATPLGRALAGWIARCARRHDDPRARAVAFMRNRKLPPALHRWCEEVEVRRQLRRAVSGIGNAPLRMAYNTWFATVSTAAEARAAVEDAPRARRVARIEQVVERVVRLEGPLRDAAAVEGDGPVARRVAVGVDEVELVRREFQFPQVLGGVVR